MSAIWGVVDWNKNDINSSVMETFDLEYRQCKIDKFDYLVDKGIYVGAGVQFFTPEAVKEEMPVQNQNSILCADIVLDNRDEICKMLDIDASSISDGAILNLLLQSKKINEETMNLLLGAFSFVYIDQESDKVYLAVDSVGIRSLYYSYDEGKLMFSTLMNPINNCLPNTTVHEKWFADFLGMDNLLVFTDGESTCFNEIHRVEPGEFVVISKGQIEKHEYWIPNRKTIHRKNDSEYKEEFRNVFQNAVKRILRSNGETGILLSGGLDSTSVACFATNELSSKNKKLYSFTSVPLKEYETDFPANRITNETDLVLKTKEFLGNIECEFIDMAGVNPWRERERMVQILEMPYKSVMNTLWINQALENAYNKNVRIMLTGSFGNSSISFGSLEIYLRELRNKKKFLRFFAEVNRFQKIYRYGRKRVIKSLLFGKSGNEPQITYEALKNSYLKEEAIKTYQVKERFDRRYAEDERELDNFESFKKIILRKDHMRQMGEFETKRSLHTGVLIRDPARDREVIEFCMSLPIDQFTKDGISRRLVNVYLEDIMPPHVIRNTKHGRQSADLKYRFALDWENIRAEWLEIYKRNLNNELIDVQRAYEDITKKASIQDYEEFDLVRHMYTIIVIEYLSDL